MHRYRQPVPFMLLTLAALSAGGCLRSTEPANFYQLQPLTVSRQQPADVRPVVVGVGPIKLASYLDRPQIVVAEGRNRLQLDEFQRWSEPLQENLTRVLAENLSRLHPADHVIIYPWHRNDGPELQLEARIDRFHTDGSGASVLDVAWSISRGGATVYRKRSNYQAAAQPRDTESLVSAQSELLAAFAREAGSALDTFRQP
ncbi:PqiC family protein [Methylococcus mesophilus]|uniref:PqiC family protein n=1 Tax=Methylococcus mesophilus TaxID=2993564 RepID=UPI00224B28FB|nr:PqiC family protein [Methylococcus mesophilus]UZR30479.1 PqiC family protein [Methylococcus mesophilus]